MKKIFIICFAILSCTRPHEKILEAHLPIVSDACEKVVHLFKNNDIGELDNTVCDDLKYYGVTHFLTNDKMQQLLKPIVSMKGVEFVIITYVKKNKEYKILPSVSEFCTKYQELRMPSSCIEEGSIKNLAYTTRIDNEKTYKVLSYVRFLEGGGFIDILIILNQNADSYY